MFSVIIPVYNHERYLRQAVLSAVRSRLVTEVLLLDDGSTDGSYTLVRELSGGALERVRDITPKQRVNRGAHVCLNELTRAATCEWIAILNSDDLFVADRFEVIERRLRMRKADFIFGDLTVVDEQGRQLGIKNGPFHPQYRFPPALEVNAMAANGEWAELLANQNFIATTSNMTFRRSLFEKLGGFAPYRYIHDWDFALRAAILGKALYLPHPLTCYRVHSSNTIKESSLKVDDEVRALFRAIQADFPEFAGQARVKVAMQGNEYLDRRAGPVLAVNLRDAEVYLESLKGRVNAASGEGEFLYSPTSPLCALRPEHLQNALLALAFQDLDFVFVSHSLEQPPKVGATAILDAVVYRRRARGFFEREEACGLRGRVARLLPGAIDATTLELPASVVWEGAQALETPEPDGIVHHSNGKPLVFVLPRAICGRRRGALDGGNDAPTA